MKLDIAELKRKTEDYFAEVTEDQLHKDLIESGLDLYSDKDFDFLDELLATTGVHTRMGDEANNIHYETSGARVSREVDITIEVNRPTYPLRKIVVETSNQESNLIRKFLCGSSLEDSFLGGGSYGYIRGL